MSDDRLDAIKALRKRPLLNGMGPTWREQATMSDLLKCPVCDERKPVVFGDMMCADCRADFISRCFVVNDPVERILSQHQHLCGISDLYSTLCVCGETFSGGPGYHRRHIATLIYKALGVDGPIPWAGVVAEQDKP